MIANKHITKIAAAALCFCFLACGFIVYAANTFDTAQIPEYQTKMFGDEVATIDIIVDEAEWQAAMARATAKEWVAGDLVINGTRFSTVGIRTKGNSSLSTGMGSSSDRYSLQFKANKYVRGQTFFGLDTFCVNNMMGDATYMKDYIAHDIMRYIGVDAPLTNFAKVTVNGEDYGFGIMLERYDQSFLERVYGAAAGQLYNVKIGMGMRGDFEDMWQDVENFMPGERGQGERGQGERGQGGRGGMGGVGGDIGSFGGFEDMQQGGGRGMGGFGGMGGGMGGGSLVYTDDNIGSYSAIFDNAIFSPSDGEKQRVITALENLNAGTELETYIDVDAALRYFAAHTVMVNADSYTSNMAQNYYLLEQGGQLTILPWDYNLSFGGFMSGDARSTVNFPISTPVSGVSMEDRPLLNMLLEVDEYRQIYYGYLREIVEGYFESGLYERTVRELDAKINEHVKNDVNAYHTYEQYQESLPVLIELGRLRAESIKGQLDGIIPSTSSGQNADSSTLVDASHINLSALGGGMGGGMGGGRGGMGGLLGGDGQGGFGGGGMGGFPDGGNFEMPEGFEVPEGGFGGGGMGGGRGGMGGLPGGDGQGGFPDGGNFDLPTQGMNRLSEAPSQISNNMRYIITIAASVLLLVGAIIFIAKPRKKTELGSGNN